MKWQFRTNLFLSWWRKQWVMSASGFFCLKQRVWQHEEGNVPCTLETGLLKVKPTCHLFPELLWAPELPPHAPRRLQGRLEKVPHKKQNVGWWEEQKGTVQPPEETVRAVGHADTVRYMGTWREERCIRSLVVIPCTSSLCAHLPVLVSVAASEKRNNVQLLHSPGCRSEPCRLYADCKADSPECLSLSFIDTASLMTTMKRKICPVACSFGWLELTHAV